MEQESTVNSRPDHSELEIKKSIQLIITRFNAKFFLKLLKLRNPSQKLKNLILVFLTIFHDQLNDLIDENQEPPEYM